jgi:hypothetical protein
MPTISVFFGIMIRMYYDDHAPPHFHAYYGSESAVIEIETLRVVRGRLSRRVSALVLEWSSEYRVELLANWFRAQRHEPLMPIEPLE